MKNIIKIIPVCFVFLFSSNLYGESGGAAFLKKGVGARALAMGGAYVSLTDDTSSLYWNPAGLGRVQDFSVAFMGTSGASDEWTGLKDMTPSQNFAAISIPISRFTKFIGDSVVALGFINSVMDNVARTYDENGEPVAAGKFADTQNAFYLSWGMPIWEDKTNLYAGVSFKYITENMEGIDGGSASGYDIDAGVIYNIFETLNFGLFISKGAAVTWDGGETDNAALTSKFGVSNKFNINEKIRITGALDIIQVQKEPLGANVGAEFSYLDVYDNYNIGLSGIHIRGGISSLALENRYGARDAINENITYCIGFGIDLLIFGKFLQLDYALGMGNIYDRQNKISLNFYF
ncbi:MAG: hypothetical protein LBQ47_04400 [Endomicrobium sp.]|jgi:hypothetical protein|nr:hypothetical protein [Endomicrobium sp.]